MPECTEDQLSDFPERMRMWFYNVMEELVSQQKAELVLYSHMLSEKFHVKLTK